MDDTTQTAIAREGLIEAVAALWARGLAEQDARTPETAAKAAGMSSPGQVADWIAEHCPGPHT